MIPSIFLGVGAWGAAVTTDLRAQLIALHGSLDRTPIFGWLGLGFRSQSESWPGWNESEKIALDFEAPDALALWCQLSAPANGALSRALSDPHLQGAGEVRGRARFGLWRNWPQLETQLRQVLQSVTLAESQEKSALVLGPISNRLNVYIVADLGEVTGGGIATELAFALKTLLEATGQGRDQTQIIGVLALPPLASPPRDLARAYAALRELHHWNDSQNVFHAQTAGRVFRGGAPKTAFDMAYLWATGNASGYGLTPEKLRRAAVQWLSLDLNSDSATHRAAERNRLLAAQPLDEWGQSTRYFAAGVAALEFPREALSQAVAASLAGAAWKKAFFPAIQHSSEECNKLILEWMQRHHLDAETLLSDMCEAPEPDAPYRIGDLIEVAASNWRGNLALLQNGAPETVQDQFDACYSELAQPLAARGDNSQLILKTPLASNEGDLARQLRARFDGIGEQWRRAAADFSIERAVDAEWGAGGAQKLVQIAIERTQVQETRLARAVEEGLAAIEAQKSALQTGWAQLSYFELKKHGGFLGKGLKKRQEALVSQLVETGAALSILALEQQALTWLRASLTDAREIWTRPQNDLKAFLDQAHEGERLLRKKESDCQRAAPVIGQMVLDARRSRDLPEATRFYAGHLASELTAAGVDLWKEVHRLPNSPLQRGAFIALMTKQESVLGNALYQAALARTRPFFAQISALDLFDELQDSQALAANRVQELFRAADAYFPLSTATVTPGWNAHSLIRTRRAAFRNAQRPIARSIAEEGFAGVLKGLGFSQNEGETDSILEIADGTRAVFWSEIGGFPLRSAGDYLGDLKAAYQRELSDPLAAPLHCREDIGYWLPIDAPSPQRQEAMWRKIMLGLALGAIRCEAVTALEDRFVLRAAEGATDFALGEAPNLAGATQDSFQPWRAIVLAAEEQSLGPVLEAHLALGAQMQPSELIQKLRSFLESLPAGAFRAGVSQSFSEWRDEVFTPQREETERQLSVLSTVLGDETRAHLHLEAGKRQAILQTRLALLQGEPETAAPGDAASELERLLTL